MKNFAFKQFNIGEFRCDVKNNPEYPSEIRKLFDEVLEKDQTFFDGVNAHLLYAFTEREAPFLHHSVQLIFNEPAQEAYIHQFEKEYSKGRIPIVIYGHSDTSLQSAIDGIAPEVSLFKLDEFIYTHYEPWLWVNGFHLWKDKNRNFSYENVNITQMPYVKQNFDMELLPYVWGNFDKKIKQKFPQELYNISEARNIEAKTPINFSIPTEIDKSSGNYIYCRITADKKDFEEGVLTYENRYNSRMIINGEGRGVVTLTYGNKYPGNCSFALKSGTHDYLIRISTLYYWINENQNFITLNSSIPVKLEKFSILKGD